MKIIPPANGIPQVSGPTHPQSPAAAPQAPKETARNFDQISIAQKPDEAGRFELELKSRLSQEARTVTTTGMLAELHRQVQAGEYKPDAESIARRMLLLEDQ